MKTLENDKIPISYRAYSRMATRLVQLEAEVKRIRLAMGEPEHPIRITVVVGSHKGKEGNILRYDRFDHGYRVLLDDGTERVFDSESLRFIDLW